MTAPAPRAYTAGQVADLLQLHYKTVLALIREGRLKAVKFGPHWRIPDHEVERLLSETDPHVA